MQIFSRLGKIFKSSLSIRNSFDELWIKNTKNVITYKKINNKMGKQYKVSQKRYSDLIKTKKVKL